MRPDLGQILSCLLSITAGVAKATSRILRLKHGERWPEDGMQYGILVFSGSLSCRNRVEYRISDFVMTDVRVTFDDLVRVQIMKLALLLP